MSLNLSPPTHLNLHLLKKSKKNKNTSQLLNDNNKQYKKLKTDFCFGLNFEYLFSLMKLYEP